MADLSGRTAIVTGASSGMGRAVSVGMAAAGARVVLVGRRAARLRETQDEISGDDRAVAIECDVTSDDAPSLIVEGTIHSFGAIDALVHCAGVFLQSPFEQSLSQLDEQWATNVRAPYALTVAALPALRERKGSVIFFSSIAGRVGFPNGTAYCVTKGAIEQLTKALAVEEAANQVRVNAIAPGNIETPMNAHLMANPDYLASMIEATPLGRNGVVQDIVPMVVLLASDDGAYMTGQSFVIDGGWTAQ